MSVIILLSLLGCMFHGTFAVWSKAMEVPGMYQGDIQLNPDQWRLIKNGKNTFGSIVGKRWPGGIIPYSIDSSIPWGSAGRTAISNAIAQYHQHTCLQFRQKKWNDANSIRFFKGTGCNSPVGMSGGVNHISLDSGCWFTGTTMHEIGHSIGLEHEQARGDRNLYITINKNNIDGDWEDAFAKQPNINSLNTNYDLASMMHYSSTAFAKPGTYTITTKDATKQSIIGHGDNYPGFSAIDKQQIALMYAGIC